ncbi:MAG: Molybdenum cofactor biosynthesis protein MoaB [uncultured Rubrobacteraceae bacterium]|uniref:Molybdenum cofactor biosynthesis protein B n=1 Tax=uncultured Rubrobacteraceae bacterium TaxID=349277 RepID=A0A6J4Q030_9ACTN|nr:MAG: Molybdenum cofactor biosynthesis protein MoaB [uncultured Rubrobacteraceae bacterium]
MSESVEKHREASPERVRVAVLTISDTRTPETDTGGNAIVELMQEAGHEIPRREIVKDDAPRIEVVLQELLNDDGVDAVITTGGTGISARDTTYEVVSRLIDKKLDGFGEIFRMISYEEIGAAAILSRAVAGASGSKFVACLPGSTNAVRLATEKLLAPEISHVVFELRKHRMEDR